MVNTDHVNAVAAFGRNSCLSRSGFYYTYVRQTGELNGLANLLETLRIDLGRIYVSARADLLGGGDSDCSAARADLRQSHARLKLKEGRQLVDLRALAAPPLRENGNG